MLSNTFGSKVAVAVLGVALAASAFAFAPVANAQTTAELNAQIQSLLATIAQLQAQIGGSSSGSGASMTFTRDLTLGSTGSDVTALQNWLIGKGHTIPAGATGYFGAQTQSALAAWQAANGVTPAAGYFGPVTRAKVNAMAGTGTGTGTGTGSTSGDLEGGAGSIDSYDELSGFSNEEVGEDEEDVEVAGLEIETDEGSDIEITAVKLDLDQTTATNDDFDEFVTEVSIWLDGEEVARVDADEFQEDDAWTKTISLDDGAIIRAGETGELTVAMSGVGNIDSDDAGDTWTVDFETVRFRDADGASVTDTTSTDDFTFSVNTFATASDVELKIAESSDNPDAQVINVDTSDDTDGVELLRFTLEAEGGDIMVKDLPVLLTVSGVADVDLIANTLRLEIDGEEFSEVVSTATLTAATVTFDDVDYTVNEGEEVEVVVTADINDEESTFGDGDTLKAELRSYEVDAIDADDETGEELAAADLTGTALGDEMAFYDVGIMVTLDSVDESVVDGGSNAYDGTGTFTIKYRVEAFDGTVVVGDTAGATSDTGEDGLDESAIPSSASVVYVLERSGSATTDNVSQAVTFTTSGGATESGITNGVQLEDGESTVFTLTVTRTNDNTGDSGLFRVLLDGIGWATSDTTSMNVYDFDLLDYKTDIVSVN